MGEAVFTFTGSGMGVVGEPFGDVAVSVVTYCWRVREGRDNTCIHGIDLIDQSSCGCYVRRSHDLAVLQAGDSR